MLTVRGTDSVVCEGVLLASLSDRRVQQRRGLIRRGTQCGYTQRCYDEVQ